MSAALRVDLLTTSRADLSLMLPVAEAVSRERSLQARLVVTGSHAAAATSPPPDTGELETTVVPAPGLGDGPAATATALAAMTEGFSKLWAGREPALCVLLGDRYELLPPATVAVLLGIPIAHLFGGEEDVAYCLDTQVRDAVTKLSHLHFVSHEATRERLLAMGEEPWRVLVAGHPALDRPRPSARAFLDHAKTHGWGEGPFIAACYHPPTTLRGTWRGELPVLLAALHDYADHTVVWTGVNSDPEGRDVEQYLRESVRARPNHVYVESLGPVLFPSLLSSARALVGNSSAGLLEAASHGLPVVNVGSRQAGRLCGENVESVPAELSELRRALLRALRDAEHRRRVLGLANPFHRPGAAAFVAREIAGALLRTERQRLLVKRGVGAVPLHGLTRVPDAKLVETPE